MKATFGTHDQIRNGQRRQQRGGDKDWTTNCLLRQTYPEIAKYLYRSITRPT